MNKFKNLNYIFLIVFLYSCNPSVIVYYHETSQYDGGEIWGSDLDLFFDDSEDISINKLSSRDINLELTRIKKVLEKKKDIVEIDDNFYEYAFILGMKDTLYTNSAFEEWRYNNFKSKTASSIESLMDL